MPIRQIVPILALSALLLLPAHGQLLQNGSFESPSIGNGLLPNFGVYTSGGIPGWTVTSGAVSIVNPGTILPIVGLLAADTGSQYAVLNGLGVNVLGALTANSPGTIAQTFTTTPGNTYQINFAYSGISANLLNSSAALTVTVDGFNPYAANPNGLLSVSLNSFQTASFNFVATGNSAVLSFGEPGGALANASGVGLDRVSASDLGPTPVPEPAEYAAMGLGLLGILALRRKFASESAFESGALA